jgi:hypothetical protein
MSGHLLILQAIALKKCLSATYNRVEMKFAPHILYTRHGDMHMDAVALIKAGREPREYKMGTFKVMGLSDLALIEEDFEASPLFEPWADKYRAETLFALE